MLGGLSWFAIPWGFASCLGLAARALVSNVCLNLPPIIRVTFQGSHILVVAKIPNIPESPICLSN